MSREGYNAALGEFDEALTRAEQRLKRTGAGLDHITRALGHNAVLADLIEALAALRDAVTNGNDDA